ncbi:Phytol kinase 1- chloroplastic [Striga hermonthica]|uniref:phytol kinase n=1 Tax=Striga hermonthica TaxID=68872 RepID=A0A9N7MLK4_STRHE|nr:Phytol kinase 1- chloroplastic [Striga hermonthica]
MILGAAMRLSLRAPSTATALSFSHFVSLRSPIPSSGPRLFPASLPPHILTKPRGRRPNISTAAGFGVSVLNDAGATTLVVGGAYALTLSRKLVHILSGLLFLASWPIFSTSTGARYFASIVPFINCLRLLMNGLSLTTDEGLIKSVSREGKPEELLKGPLYYVLVLILCAVVFWRESPIGMIALSMMCGGDGIADIMGRRFGSLKLPYNSQKSWVGSISMFLFGFLVTFGMLCYYAILGYIQLDWIETAKRVALVSFVATVVESLPITGIIDDNLSVPLVSIVASFLVFGF